jgi:flagellar motor switch protein FliN/FliY
MTIRETLGICRGTIISLDRLAGEPADLLVNGRLVARGEVIAIDEEFGLRVTEVIAPESRYEPGTAIAALEAGS